MADEVDIAQIQNELAQEALLQQRRPVSDIHPIGECHFCAEPFDPDSLKLFCDGVCATNHDRRKGRM
jgi:hypothetical protein